MTHLYKKTLTAMAVASMLVLTSCGAPVPTDEDATAVMQEARSNLVAELISSMEKDPHGTSMINFEGTAAGNGVSASFTGKTDVKGAIENDTTLASYMITLDGSAEVPSLGKVSGSLEAELRAVGQKLYGNLLKVAAESENAELDAQIKQMLPLVSIYSAKWYMIDQDALQSMSAAGTAAVNSLDKEEMKAVLEELKNYEIFNLEEKMTPANGNFVYKVSLNADGIASLVEAVNNKANPTTPMAESDLQEVKDTVTAFNSEKGLTHTLYIDATTKKYKKFETKGTLSDDNTTVTSVIEAPKDEAITWVASLESTNTSTNSTESVKIDFSKKDGKIEGKFVLDIPGASPITADITMSGTYNKDKVTIEEPSDAADLTQMLGGSMNSTPTTSTGELMEDETDAASLMMDEAVLENAMGE